MCCQSMFRSIQSSSRSMFAVYSIRSLASVYSEITELPSTKFPLSVFHAYWGNVEPLQLTGSILSSSLRNDSTYLGVLSWESLLLLWNDRLQKYITDCILKCRIRTILVNHKQSSTTPFHLEYDDQSSCLLLLIILSSTHPSLLALLDNSLYCHVPQHSHPLLASLLPTLLEVSTRMDKKKQKVRESEENQTDEVVNISGIQQEE